ncbi:18518_t:CDS:2 [Entrophospora sp. SA101]|nr:10122_t:CDS:2 [Entrophospora sp. SA101]CAJ0757850.1 18518_t:CDS:2 [Entrophospora sp. SA101]CAJ0909453.1 9488_t:CDS:2 [Entrophospora sp. SA101]
MDIIREAQIIQSFDQESSDDDIDSDDSNLTTTPRTIISSMQSMQLPSIKHIQSILMHYHTLRTFYDWYYSDSLWSLCILSSSPGYASGPKKTVITGIEKEIFAQGVKTLSKNIFIKDMQSCSNGGGMLWDRDVNASRNIRDTYIFTCKNGGNDIHNLLGHNLYLWAVL